MTPKAIFFDIDGTLVSFKTKSVPASAKTAINQLRNKGIKVIISTGRAFYDIDNLGDLEFDGYITANGACCIDAKGGIISQYLLSKESLNKFAFYLEENPVPCAFMTNNGNYINFADDATKSVHHLINLPIPPVAPVSEIIEYDVFQMSVFIGLEKESELLNILTECSSSRWHPSFTDFNVKNICKASGIDCFLKYYDIERKYTMAFGDGGNDITMLKHAATGVAMDNANDAVKKVADYVTTSIDEDGIINALRYFNVL